MFTYSFIEATHRYNIDEKKIMSETTIKWASKSRSTFSYNNEENVHKSCLSCFETATNMFHIIGTLTTLLTQLCVAHQLKEFSVIHKPYSHFLVESFTNGKSLVVVIIIISIIVVITITIAFNIVVVAIATTKGAKQKTIAIAIHLSYDGSSF